MQHVNISKILIRNKTDGTYLILRSGEWPERPDRSLKPDLPGGLVDPGEDHYDAMIREVKEEVGFDIKRDTLNIVHGDSLVNEKNEAVTRLIFFAEVADPVITLSWEHDQYTWMTATEILGLVDMRKPYPEIFQYLSKVGVLV